MPAQLLQEPCMALKVPELFPEGHAPFKVMWPIFLKSKSSGHEAMSQFAV